jgi:regulator of RNase E activity RraB
MHSYPDDDDGDALRRIAGESDMSRPMTIDFMVVVPDERAGRAVAEAAVALGYTTAVSQDDDSGDWTCYCSRSMLATYAGVIEAQAELDQVAAPYRGYTDGWGTFGNRLS